MKSATKEFGDRFKYLLEKHNITQSGLCKISGISQSSMYYWANGIKNMRIKNFALIVDALGLTAREIAYLLEAFWEEEDG